MTAWRRPRSSSPPQRAELAGALEKLRAWTPVQIAALAFGAWWVSNGVAVFLAEPSGAALSTDGAVHVFGLSIAVNGWHGVFHLSTGLAGVAVCWRPRASRAYVLLMGIVYVGAALCSVFTGATVFGLIHVDELGSADHALEGVVMLAVWAVSRREARGVMLAAPACGSSTPPDNRCRHCSL
jgi:hypothetical protein